MIISITKFCVATGQKLEFKKVLMIFSQEIL